MKQSGNNNKGKKKAAEEKSAPAEEKTVRESRKPLSKNALSILSYALGVAAVLLLVLFIADWAGSSAWFTVFTKFWKGMFSFAAFGTPFILLYCAYFLAQIAKERKHKWNVILAITLLLNVSVMAGLILNAGNVGNPVVEYAKGKEIAGGGIFGAYVSWLFVKALSIVGGWILCIALALAQIVFLVGLTMSDAGAFFGRLFKKIGAAIGAFFAGLWSRITKRERKPDKKTKKQPAPDEPDDGEDDAFVPPPPPPKDAKYYHKPLTDENPYVDDVKDEKGAGPDPVIPSDGEASGKKIREDAPDGWGETGGGKIRRTTQGIDGGVDLEKIFRYDPDDDRDGGKPVLLPIGEEDGEDDESGDGGDAAAARRLRLSTVTDDGEEPVKAYTFPPVSLLAATPSKQTDVTEELQSNATRLVEALRSFRVGTNIVNISRGPTITRYELQPDEGVRVRQIASLVDDISLQLASSGVRIEAPIPGKSAVGIEVPNKTRETVFLRTLIDNERFSQSSAKLTAAVGVDVAGDPVYVDLAKMPHLLIAGTTGSGKSVCMNCLILSILYKATPDEVKMIMIDPKKVEFNVYNGLPHLVIPVVSNSKKAAGALAWAVGEMERRYELIEQAAVRDIYSYNKATADDPDKEYMPQLVIIIDELADLMLTAPGEVEESICRIAAKGRACGMHLIIGTQRPSVDVITGLIKANVPSRIAFTVSSQIDSRTIIDMPGAEKLVGKGDMLFYPIGYMKPVRLQGAFVSDGEVEEVTKFIIDHSEETVYDDQVMKDIDKQAELCGSKGKKPAADVDAGEDDGESDPMLKAAIDLAVESGKISTSLIQRRLSLGYGRAAKLIDEMEKRGIVSPPEGQKPRTVLISASEWNEMRMRSEE